MNSVATLLRDLGMAGVEIAADAHDPAAVRHRPARLTQHLIARLRMSKPEILCLLGAGEPIDEDHGYIFNERLGVAIDLNMPVHPGTPAWCIAMGEGMGGAAFAQRSPTPDQADRLAGIVGAVLGGPVRATALPPGERFPGEPRWSVTDRRPQRRPSALQGFDP